MVRMDYRHRQSRRKSIDEPGHAHELTFSIYKRFSFLRSERMCQWLAESIEAARTSLEFQLWAYVFMPDHVHLIVYPTNSEQGVSRILKKVKEPVSKRAFRFLEAEDSPWIQRLTRRRGQRTERLFWQSGGGFDRNITERDTLESMIEYLHLNPVRKRYVERARDWKWSSAAWFEGDGGPLRVDPIPRDW